MTAVFTVRSEISVHSLATLIMIPSKERVLRDLQDKKTLSSGRNGPMVHEEKLGVIPN